MGDVTELDDWRQRRAILEIADKVGAMAQSLGAPLTAQEPADAAGDVPRDLDQPF